MEAIEKLSQIKYKQIPHLLYLLEAKACFSPSHEQSEDVKKE